MRLLLEDATDDLINQAIAILKSTSEVVQTALTDNYNTTTGAVEYDPADIRSRGGYNALSWNKAAAMATKEDMAKLAEAFVLLLEARYPNFANDIKEARDVYLHILTDVGFDNKSNPFIRYISNSFIDGKTITRPQLILLNNLYSDGTIDIPDLERKGTSILYNPNIWSKLNSKQAESLLRNYYYIRNHRKAYDETVSKKHPDIKARVAAHPDDMEDYIVTISGDVKNGSDFEDLDKVDEFVNTYFKSGFASKLKTTLTKTTTTTKSKLTTDKKHALDKAILDGSLKYSDVKDILAYLEELHNTGTFN